MGRNGNPADEEEQNEIDEQQIAEEFNIWKRNTVFLYDLVIAHALLWPSLTVEWFPTHEVIADRGISKQRLLLGTHTSDGEQNHLLVAEVNLPLEDAELEEREGDKGGFATAERYQVIKAINHEGEVNRARLMPLDSNIVATKTATKDVFIFKLDKHPNKIASSGKCIPDIRLTGHSAEGFGLNWSRLKQGYLVSGANDKQVCVWDVLGAQGRSGLQALHVFKHHTADVEDVSWHRHDPNIFGSVGDDKQLCLWDVRASGDKAVQHSVEAHDDVVNSLAFHPTNQHLLVTGSSDQTLGLFDLRSLSSPVHTLTGHKGEVIQLSWNEHHSSILASASQGDNRVIIWDLNRIGDEQTPDEAEDGPPELLFTHGGHCDRVSDFAWNPLKPWMLSSVADDNIMQIWQMAESLYEDDSRLS